MNKIISTLVVVGLGVLGYFGFQYTKPESIELRDALQYNEKLLVRVQKDSTELTQSLAQYEPDSLTGLLTTMQNFMNPYMLVKEIKESEKDSADLAKHPKKVQAIREKYTEKYNTMDNFRTELECIGYEKQLRNATDGTYSIVAQSILNRMDQQSPISVYVRLEAYEMVHRKTRQYLALHLANLRNDLSDRVQEINETNAKIQKRTSQAETIRNTLREQNSAYREIVPFGIRF